MMEERTGGMGLRQMVQSMGMSLIQMKKVLLVIVVELKRLNGLKSRSAVDWN